MSILGAEAILETTSAGYLGTMMSDEEKYDRLYRRQMTRSGFQSLFWHVLLTRKKEFGLTLKGLADKLGINKSYMSRSFSSPPNWQIDKLSDMADALDVDIIIEARDRKSGRVYTPHGGTVTAVTTTYQLPGPADRLTATKSVENVAS